MAKTAEAAEAEAAEAAKADKAAKAAKAMVALARRSAHQAQAAPPALRLSIPRWSTMLPPHRRSPLHSSRRLGMRRLSTAACCSMMHPTDILAMVAQMEEVAVAEAAMVETAVVAMARLERRSARQAQAAPLVLRSSIPR